MGQKCMEPCGKHPTPKYDPSMLSAATGLTMEEDIWIQYVDHNSGIPYFHNLQTMETSWEPPDVQYLVHPSVIDWIHNAEPSNLRGKKSEKALSYRKHDNLRMEQALASTISTGSSSRGSMCSPKNPKQKDKRYRNDTAPTISVTTKVTSSGSSPFRYW
mmetsp:Transcript_10061/g.24770  ORF Transcript_10061/g.24770 Transcript_10061/m.24770 type:complete len:159 (-) Transcript_10061:1087-1563(-)